MRKAALAIVLGLGAVTLSPRLGVAQVSTVNITSPTVGSSGAAGPFADQSSMTIGGSFTYEWGCVFTACVPHHIQVLASAGNGDVLLDVEVPHSTFTDVAWGSGNWSHDWDEIDGNPEQSGQGVIYAWPETSAGQNMTPNNGRPVIPVLFDFW